MNAKSGFALAALAVIAAAALASASPARAGEKMAAAYCASGYHPDARGDCQPDTGTPRVCQPGFHYEVFPNGDNYRCWPDGY